MQFGLMYEIQVPEPHYEDIEQERYKQLMAQVELADEVGFHYAWTVEHHFLRGSDSCMKSKCRNPTMKVSNKSATSS